MEGTPEHPVRSGELQRLFRQAPNVDEFHVDFGDRTREEKILRLKRTQYW